MNYIAPGNKWVGQRTQRPDGIDKVTGSAQYSADFTMPGMIWGKVLRSPHAHATIRKIDTQSKLYTTTGITKRVSPAAKTKLIIKPHPSRA